MLVSNTLPPLPLDVERAEDAAGAPMPADVAIIMEVDDGGDVVADVVGPAAAVVPRGVDTAVAIVTEDNGAAGGSAAPRAATSQRTKYCKRRRW